MNPSYSFLFVIVVFNLLELRELFFFLGTLDMRFLGGVREGRTSRRHMSTFLAAEVKSLLDALLSFFWGKFLREFDCVNIHGVGVLGGSRGRGKSLESLSGPSTSLSDLLSAIPLILEVGCLRVPVVNFVWDCVKGHDPFHEWGGDSGSEETNQDIMVHDAGVSGVALKRQDVALKRGGELPVFLNHTVGGQPGNGIPSCVLMFKGLLELFKEVVPGSKGDGSAVDGVSSEGFSPGLGRSFSHIRESKSDFLHVVAVRGLVYCKVELDGVHP